MDLKDQSSTLGIILLALGGVSLLTNLGWFGGFGEIFAAIILGGLGFYLIQLYMRHKRHFWLAIVSFALFGSAAATVTGALAGMYFLALLALGFVLTARDNPRHWWAVIPAGILLSLASMLWMETLWPGLEEAPILFLGFALTFGYLYMQKHGWAIYPAIVAIGIAFITSGFTGSWIFPLVLVAAGIYLLRRPRSTYLIPQQESTQETPHLSEDIDYAQLQAQQQEGQQP